MIKLVDEPVISDFRIATTTQADWWVDAFQLYHARKLHFEVHPVHYDEVHILISLATAGIVAIIHQDWVDRTLLGEEDREPAWADAVGFECASYITQHCTAHVMRSAIAELKLLICRSDLGTTLTKASAADLKSKSR